MSFSRLKIVFPLITFVGVGGLGVLELFSYRGMIEARSGIDYFLITVVGIVFILLSRIFLDKKVSKSALNVRHLTSKLSLIFFGVITVAGVLFIGMEYYLHDNYMFGNYGINPFVTLELSMFSLAMHVVTATKKHLQTYWPSYFLLGF